MKLESIRLKNIRAFEDSGEITFGDGTISIYGENGAGKSTIVNCIGRAVFGWDIAGRKREVITYDGSKHKHGETEYLLRKSTQEGSIDVKFSHKGHNYHVINSLSRAAQSWELYIDGTNTKMHGKDEIHERIWDELSAPESYGNSLDRLFGDVICVPQGHVVNEFEFSPQSRKDHFDKILGLYAYRQAFEDSKHVKNNFKNKIDKERSDVLLAKSNIDTLRGLVEKLRKDEADLAALQTLILGATSDVERLLGLKKPFEELYNTIETLTYDVTLQKSKIESAKDMLETLQAEVTQCREAKEIVEKLNPSYVRYNEVSRQIEIVRSLLREIAKEKEALSDLRIKSHNLERDREGKLEKLDTYDSNAERLVDLAPYFDNYVKLEKLLAPLHISQQKYELAMERMLENQALMASKKSRMKELNVELEEYDVLRADAEPLEDLRTSFDLLTKKIGELNGRKAHIERDLTDLLSGVCPFTNNKCESIAELGSKQEEELSHITADLEHLELDKATLLEIIAKANESNKKLHALEGKKRELELIDADIERLESEIEGSKEVAHSIGDKSAEIVEITASLEELKPRFDEYNSLKFDVEHVDRDSIAKELEHIDSKRASLRAEIEAANNRVADLVEKGGNEHVEKSLDQERKELMPEYDAYVASLKTSERFERAVQRCESYRASLYALEDAYERTKQELNAKERLYNRDEHVRIDDEYDRKRSELDEMKGTESQLLREIDAGKEYEAALEQKKEELMELDVELNEILADSSFFDEIRESFKKLSEMRSAFTGKVSQRAARHWREMIGDGSEIHWQEDYLIFKTVGDDVISLYEMSGGEKISACLAARLALQEVLGGLGLFILDEPTTHLDEDRCDNLARQIGSITGLNQVIVISHDETFGAYTKQQINIKKATNGGGSTVEW
jgi:exonuclease SbcC